MADRNGGRNAPLSGDALYGDRESLRRYRDSARDEHRRFGALYEREHGGGERRDVPTDYDRVGEDLTRVDYRPERRHATEGGYPRVSYELRSPRERFSGTHRGRGPRNYQRSYQRLHEKVCEALMEDDNIDASEVEVNVTDGEVTLTGTLRSRNTKRWTTDLVESIPGVKDVHNTIRVSDEQVWPPRSDDRGR